MPWPRTLQHAIEAAAEADLQRAKERTMSDPRYPGFTPEQQYDEHLGDALLTAELSADLTDVWAGRLDDLMSAENEKFALSVITPDAFDWPHYVVSMEQLIRRKEVTDLLPAAQIARVIMDGIHDYRLHGLAREALRSMSYADRNRVVAACYARQLWDPIKWLNIELEDGEWHL